MLFLDQEFQNNCGCREEADSDREWFLEPTKDQKYPGLGTDCEPSLEKSRVIVTEIQGLFTETLLFKYLMFNRTD